MGKVQRLGNSAGSAAFKAGSLLSPGELGRRELLLWKVRQLFQKIMQLIKSSGETKPKVASEEYNLQK